SISGKTQRTVYAPSRTMRSAPYCVPEGGKDIHDTRRNCERLYPRIPRRRARGDADVPAREKQGGRNPPGGPVRISRWKASASPVPAEQAAVPKHWQLLRRAADRSRSDTYR